MTDSKPHDVERGKKEILDGKVKRKGFERCTASRVRRPDRGVAETTVKGDGEQGR